MKVLTEQDRIEALPFTAQQQEAIVGFCIFDPTFFQKCYERIKPTWFTHNAMVATIFSQMCKFYDEHQRHFKSPEELMGEPFFVEMPMADKEKYHNTLSVCMLSTRSFDLPTMKKYLTGFIRISMFKEAIQGGADLFKVKGFGDAYEKTKVRIQDIEKATFEGDNMVMPFKNPELWLAEDAADKDKIISTGCKDLDNALQGGLYPGDSTVVLAPTNSGKTTFMLTIARHAAYQKKDVLVVVHEGRPRAIRRQMLAAMVGVSKHELVRMAERGEAAVLKEAAEFLDKYVTYVHYSKSMGMYAEDVIAEIKRRNEEKRLRTGKGYDLIVDDYPGKQKSKVMISQHAKRHEELSYIYDQYNLLAGEIYTHILAAAQTNREGYKQNKDLDKTAYLDIDKIGESYGIGTNIPNMISLNRDDADMRNNLLHLMIIKSRDSATHQTFHTFTNYECSLTHGDAAMFQEFNASDLREIGLTSELVMNSSAESSDSVMIALNKKRDACKEALNAMKTR